MSTSRPISNGDLCRVIGGLGRAKSPNLGKQVTVGHLVYGDLGEHHTQFGRTHRCTGEGIMQLKDSGEYIMLGWADFPIAWLERIDPPALPPKSLTKKLELTS